MVAVSVQYEAGHTCEEEWVPTDFACPQCAERAVWVEHSEGDYYVGPLHMCISCGASFCLPNGAHIRVNRQDMQRFHAITAALPKTP